MRRKIYLTVEVRGALPALLLVHFHGPHEDAPQTGADNSDCRERVIQDIVFKEGCSLIRRQLELAVHLFLIFLLLLLLLTSAAT